MPLVVCLLGLVGTSPTAVFAGKLTIFTAALDGGYGWLVVVAAVNTVASLFYYLRWIVGALRPAESETKPAVGRWAETMAYVTAAASVMAGPLAGLLLMVFDGELALR
ncbi:hypothetical protein [Amycolatopsis sp. NPDC051102]|uniref:hypothetical protein n=1 Tax=Amycolatopsis sp. NPDC051102 TaxID=3155163 RepID=UPI00341EE4D9